MKVHNIFISGDIVPFTFWGENEYSIANLTADLKALVVSEGDELIADINTYGGDTETGFAMYNQLLRFKNENKISLTTRVTGYCASIGTVILLAGDKRIGNQYNNPFVHNAWTMAVGDANEMKKVYEDLQKTNDKITSIYVERTNIDFETAKALMNANDFLDPSRVLEYGFYTEIENQKILNSINYKNNNNMDFKEQLKQIYNKMFHTQNKIFLLIPHQAIKSTEKFAKQIGTLQPIIPSSHWYEVALISTSHSGVSQVLSSIKANEFGFALLFNTGKSLPL